MSQPRIGGLRVDPVADVALPVLLLLFTAISVQVVAGLLGVNLGLLAFASAAESFIFTTIFFVRDPDRPWLLRLLEMVLMLFLIWMAAALSARGDMLAALVGTALLVAAWLQGARFAVLVGPLHPGNLEGVAGQERLPNDDHARALAALRLEMAVQAVVLAAVAGLAGASAVGPVILMILAFAATLVGARLKQAITWALEGLEPTPDVARRWIPQGLALLLLPLLMAVVLPAGPRVPVERWLAQRSGDGEAPFQPAPLVEALHFGSPVLPFDEGVAPTPIEGIEGVWTVLKWAGVVLGLCALLSFLAAAARQWSERVKLKGIWAVLAAWYAALWQGLRDLLGGVVRQAVAVPVETLGSLLAEGGALARLVPAALGRAPSDPRAALRFYYRRLQREAARKGLRRQPGETAAEFGIRLSAVAPEQAEAVAQLTEAYQIARYTEDPVGPEQASFARRGWLQIARALGRIS